MENIMTEQREKRSDRRDWKANSEFPFIDSNGNLISEDRRILAERRGYNIEVISFEEIELKVVGGAPGNSGM